MTNPSPAIPLPLRGPCRLLAALTVALVLAPSMGRAQELLCDTAFQDCRAPLLTLIKNETRGIDVAFWFMEDQRFVDALVARHRAGVPIRILMDPRANATKPKNGPILDQLRAAGIPMRKKVGGGILHWKMMHFLGQGKVEFSGANFTPYSFVPHTPYENYIDEVVYITADANVVQSFQRRFEDCWTDTSRYAHYANVSGTPVRRYPLYTLSPELNFPPKHDFALRSVDRYKQEMLQIDATIYRITDQRHANALIAARSRGVRVRILTDRDQYRDPMYYWHAWNVDRLYMAGVQLKINKHAGMAHQKSTVLYGLGEVVFGSSNWTSASANYQEEHNYFTRKPNFFSYFIQQFERKWTSLVEYQPFVPKPPGSPVIKAPSNGATGQPTTVVLTWDGGHWAHKYDIYFGTSSSPPLLVRNVSVGSPAAGALEKFSVTSLRANTTYYWRIVGKTMANKTASSPIRYFRTQ